MINIEVVYALPHESQSINLEMNEQSTVADAIDQSGLLLQYSLDLSQHKVGIYGKLVSLEHIVSHEDRIEIYRPLLADPKEIRRRRAKERK